LVGDAAVSAAGIIEDFIETKEIEIKYEPDYGND
jgi:preprotein translocase subunit Sec61beta